MFFVCISCRPCVDVCHPCVIPAWFLWFFLIHSDPFWSILFCLDHAGFMHICYRFPSKSMHMCSSFQAICSSFYAVCETFYMPMPCCLCPAACALHVFTAADCAANTNDCNADTEFRNSHLHGKIPVTILRAPQIASERLRIPGIPIPLNFYSSVFLSSVFLSSVFLRKHVRKTDYCFTEPMIPSTKLFCSAKKMITVGSVEMVTDSMICP